MPLILHSPVARPPWKGVGRTLESLVRKAIYTYDLLPRTGRLSVGVALSGGKDSLTLLFLLHALSGRSIADLDLVAFHVDGAFSCGAGLPRGYLQAICRELNIPLVERTSSRQIDQLECYSCSRERRKFIFEMAKENHCQVVAFGHHRDDNAQTLLLNLFHSGKPAGMLPKVPMLHYGVTIIRPLILCSEHAILEFAQTHGFARITCQCPIGQKSKRKIIKDYLQWIEKDFPQVTQHLSRASLEWGDQGALTP